MNRILDVGYVLKLSDKDFVIKKIVGTGASSVTYLAEYNKTEHILKECNPLGISMHRNEEGVLIADTKLGEEKFFDCLSRFKSAVENQLLFRLTDDLKNVTSNIQDRYDANGTSYIDMTYFGGNTYDNVADETLYDIFRRMKALAQIVGHYHKLGYLHLDIKPQNIYTIPETPEMVMMFDFDSVVQRDNAEALLSSSYTDAWAAPEQKIPKYRNQICNATDFFAIGEIIFHKIFGKHSTDEDRYSFSQYEYEVGNELVENVNPRALPMITELFHKTLSCSVKKRYQSADELIEKLDELIKLTDPKEPYLVSSSVAPKTFFIGRDDELAAIHNSFQKNNIQFLSGIGGIGKSELAKNYAKIHIENGYYDTVLFVTYNGSWMMLINDDNSINITNFGRFPEEKELDYYRRKIRKLKELSDERTLFIIDNLNEDEFENEAQKQWADVLSLGCKLLITTRQREWSYPIQNIDIFTQRVNLIDLFQNYCDVKMEADLTAVKEIIDYVGGHTLTIELIARQTKAGFLTPEKMLAKLKEHGISKSGKEKVMSEKDNQQSRKTAFEHITALFNIADLNEQEKYVLANMSLIPSDGIKAELFAEWCELEDYDAVNSLIGSGWMDRDEDVIKVHPVVAEVAIEKCLCVDINQCDRMFSNQFRYLEKYTIKQQYNNIKSTLSDVTFFSNMAERIICIDVWKKEIADILTNTALFVMDFGHLKKAEQYLQQALEIRQKLFGNGHTSVVENLNNLGTLYRSTGDLNKSKQYLQQALEAHQRLCGNEHSGADILNNLGVLYQDLNDLKKAEQYLQQVLESRQKLYGNEHSDVATSLNNLGALYHNTGDLEKAEGYLQQALEIRQKIYGNRHPDVATSLNNLGAMYKSMDNVKKAEEYLQQALETYQRLYGNRHPDVATSLNNLGVMYKSTGNVKKAEQYHLQALEIRQKIYGNEHPDVANSLNNLGTLYQDVGDLKKAEQFLLQAFQIYRKIFGDEHLCVLISLNNIGILYQNIGDLKKAEQYLQQAFEARQKLFGNENSYVATSIYNLGVLYQSAGDLKKAERYFLQAFEIYKKQYKNGHHDMEVCLNALGVLYQNIGDMKKAEQYLQQALEMCQKLYGDENPDVAVSLNSLGTLYQKVGDMKKAEQYFLHSLEIYQRLYRNEHQDAGTCLNNLGVLNQKIGDLKKAEQYLLYALDIRKKLFGNKHPDVAKTLNNLGVLYQSAGDLEKAEQYLSQAIEASKETDSTK